MNSTGATDLKRLLVPIDFSEITNGVVQAAIDIAERFDATVTLMHVHIIPPMPRGMAFAPVMDEIRSAAREQLERALANAKMRYARCDCLLRGGAIASQILDAARESHADLIVIGSSGVHGISRALLGSIAERVVHLSPISVLVVPPTKPKAVPQAQHATS